MIAPGSSSSIVNNLPDLLEVTSPDLGGLCYDCLEARRELVTRHLSDRHNLGNGERLLVDADIVVLAVAVVALFVSAD